MNLQAIPSYLEGLARPDGGYGWEDQPDSHLTPTYAAVGCYARLGRAAPRSAELAAFVRTHHPLRGEFAETGASELDLRTFLLQQIQCLRWLDEPTDDFRAEVAAWRGPAAYLYEANRYPVLREEAAALIGRSWFDLDPAELSTEWIAYFLDRRRSNGSFHTTQAGDGGDGNVLNTRWALLALKAAGRPTEDALRAATVAWLQACQLPNGGFTHQPHPIVAGIDDVAYTRAAVQALALLGAAPLDRDGCIRYLQSLQNPDGGCGDRPDLPSRPLATFYALEALQALDALQALNGMQAADRLPAPNASQTRTLAPRPMARQAPPPAGLNVYSIQLEAPGWGSPLEAVELARDLRIDLWGAKNSEPGWVERAQTLADRTGVRVRFFPSNEEYGSYFSLDGFGCYNHLSDPCAPAGRDFGPNLKAERPNWEAFRRRRIGPLEAAGGRMIWQISHDEPFTRALLDDSVARGGGYAAISTFHFGCCNMAYTVPLLFRYRHEIPFIALQDAHGRESWWWGDQLMGFRTLFLAEEPTWEAWLEALDRQWVVAARHDVKTRHKTRLLGGGPGVQDHVREREATWRWWGDEPKPIRRPLAALVAVRPDDPFEAGRPEHGVTLRVRTWWRASHLAILLEPLVELIELRIDGQAVQPEYVEIRNDKEKRVDAYHQWQIADPAPGEHVATAAIRHIETGATSVDRRTFIVPEEAH